MEKPVVYVIVWGSEVELKGLPLEIRTEAEKNGGIWVGTGLRISAEKYHLMRDSHPEVGEIVTEIVCLPQSCYAFCQS